MRAYMQALCIHTYSHMHMGNSAFPYTTDSRLLCIYVRVLYIRTYVNTHLPIMYMHVVHYAYMHTYINTRMHTCMLRNQDTLRQQA